MSRKTKSELSFLIKISLLFFILLFSKLNRGDSALSIEEDVFASEIKNTNKEIISLNSSNNALEGYFSIFIKKN